MFENDHFQICVYFWWVFFSAETTCTASWHVFYIRNRHISVSSFVYKYDQWPHDSHMTGKAGVWETDIWKWSFSNILLFYLDVVWFVDGQNHEILKPAISGFYIRFHPVYRPWNNMHCKVTCILYKKQAHFSQLFCLQVRSVTPWQSHACLPVSIYGT
jgi:hypothetical protein